MRTVIAAIIVIAVTFSSCKKYEDGPGFSLRSKKARLCNEWTVKQYFENSEDKTAEYRNLILEETFVLKKDETYTYSETSNWTWAAPADEGKWQWQDEKENVIISSTSQDKTINLHILKLKESDLWVETTDSTGKRLEYHYVPKQML